MEEGEEGKGKEEKEWRGTEEEEREEKNKCVLMSIFTPGYSCSSSSSSLRSL